MQDGCEEAEKKDLQPPHYEAITKGGTLEPDPDGNIYSQIDFDTNPYTELNTCKHSGQHAETDYMGTASPYEKVPVSDYVKMHSAHTPGFN